MGFFSEDMLPMLGVYEAETTELMAALDEIVSRVDRERAFTHEDIAELFRYAHTIKGSSAMMGLDSLSEFTHKVEDLFHLLRDDPTLAEGRVSDILDCMYTFSDFVKDEVARMEDEGFAPADASRLIADTVSFIAELGGSAHDAGSGEGGRGASDVKAPEELPAEGENDVQAEPAEDGEAPIQGAVLKVVFKADVSMVNARAMVIVRQLSSQVDLRSCTPEDLTSPSSAREIAEDGLILVVSPDDAEKAKRFLAKNSFIRRIILLDETVANRDRKTPASIDQASEPTAASADKFITLRWSSMRELQDMAGELLLRSGHLKALCDADDVEGELRGSISQMARLAEEIVFHVNEMSMVSVSAMVPQLSRMVRDMCRNTGKQVSFTVHGGGIEIDRNLYNSISDPLLHIIRNAVDHGIESPEERLAAGKEARGEVTFSVQNLGARVAFRVADDGRGIDTDKVLAKAEAKGMLDKPAESYTRAEVLEMVMLAGLSTSKEITQYSGRGVGMDVVSAVIRDFHGRVDIESTPGGGTSMTLFMPVSVTSVECLCFRIGRSVYPMPLLNLNKVFTAAEAANLLDTYEGSALFTYDKRQLPVVDMHRLLDCSGEDAFYIVCNSLDDEFVIGVDEVLGDFSCANKPLPSSLDERWQAKCPIRNVAVMDNGTVGYVLNAALLVDIAQGQGDGQRDDDGQMPDAPDSYSVEVGAAIDIPTMAFVFTLGDEWFALPVEQVERLVPVPQFATTPHGSMYLMGLANYRNQVIALFDLAKSAGVQDAGPHALILSDESGENVGFTITSAIGVRDLSAAVLAEDQPEPRVFAAGLHTVALLNVDPKEPPITLLARN